MRKKFVTGAAVLALLMGAPQVSADDEIVIFGGEFEDEVAPPAQKKVEQPAPPPPAEKPAPPPKVEQPAEKISPPQPIEQPAEKISPPQPIEQPTEKISPPQPIEQPTEKIQPPQPIEQPTEKISPPQLSVELDQPFDSPTKIFAEREPVRRSTPSYSAAPQQTLKTLKPRFIKLAVDDTYTYYLDKSSVQWKRVPYLANEYMADVWVRMVAREPSPLSDDMASYGADNFRAEVALARDRGYQYAPEDLKVLRSQSYVLEHYYLRPKTKQIQFLCELEVFGRPQNAINERAYDYKNWENLVPGSVESAIYDATIKIIGKSKADGKGHMTFIDMLEEYGRISLR